MVKSLNYLTAVIANFTAWFNLEELKDNIDK
jgi:hypothetical protein